MLRFLHLQVGSSVNPVWLNGRHAIPSLSFSCPFFLPASIHVRAQPAPGTEAGEGGGAGTSHSTPVVSSLLRARASFNIASSFLLSCGVFYAGSAPSPRVYGRSTVVVLLQENYTIRISVASGLLQ